MSAFLLSLIAQIPTSPAEAMQWVDVVKGAGGWGVAIIEGVVIFWLWKTSRQDMKEKDDKIISVLEKQNDTIKNTIGALKGGG